MPDEARGVFAEPVEERLVRYAGWLATAGVERGLIGPREVPRLWDRHLLNCAALAPLLPPSATVADVGSGAGLPGVVIAIARPDLEVTLIEPLLRRTTFLDEVVESLGLTNVTVVRGRADALHGQARFGVVTSRAVAPLDRLLEWSLPLVAPSGCVLALKGSRAAEEVTSVGSMLAAWGCAPAEVIEVQGVGGGEATAAVRVAWADPASVSWPLVPPGAPRKKQRPSSRPPRARKRRPPRDQ